MNFEHIVSTPDVFGGKPCIKGTRISVQVLLEWLANGATRADVLKAYPHISDVAFSEALMYAALQMSKEVVLHFPVGA